MSKEIRPCEKVHKDNFGPTHKTWQFMERLTGEAIAIRAEVEEIKKQDAASGPPIASKLTALRNELASHVARTSWTYPVSDSFTFNADGSLTRSDNWTTGFWVPVDEHSVLIVYAKGGGIDRITFEDKFSHVTGWSYTPGKTWDPRKVER